MTTKLPIDKLKPGALLVAKAILVGFDCAADGKFGLDDVSKIIALAPHLSALAQYKDMLAQAQDADSAEVLELVTYFGAELSLPSEKAKKIAMASLKIIPIALEIKEAFAE